MKRRIIQKECSMESRRFTCSSIAGESRQDRVNVLPDDAKTSVRASQVIGTLSRAIEELVRNSIEHGRSTVVDVKVGTVNHSTLLEVKDNGIGIDTKSTEKWIGINHCSSHTGYKNNRCDTGDRSTSNMVPSQSLKGETLKSLAALSVEFRIATSSRARSRATINEIEKKKDSRKTIPSAPSKCRKRKRIESRLVDTKQTGGMTKCEKVIRYGSVISFQSSKEHTPAPLESSSGTTIQIYGLFHNFAVRKRQYELTSHSQNEKSIHRTRLSQARSCIQILAMAFPDVTIRLFDTGSKTMDTCWGKLLVSGCTQASFIESVRHRLRQLCGTKVNSNQTFLDVYFRENEDERKHQFSAEGTVRNGWFIRGVLCMSSSDGYKDSSRERVDSSSRQLEYIFVNGKQSKQNSSLCDLIQSFIKSNIEGNTIVAYLFHIRCPSNDFDTVIDDTRSYAFIRQKTRLNDFVTKALQKALSNGERRCEADYDERISEKTNSVPQTSLRLVSSKKVASSLDKVTSSPKSEQIKMNDPTSPFSQLFMEDSKISRSDQVNNLKTDSSKKQAPLSVQEVLFQATCAHESKESTFNDELQWTRKRIKAIESEIRSLTKCNPGQRNGIGLKITKEMLSNAEFIAQLDSKFIIVNMNGILCAIDQHAADERIGLERLEKALEQKLKSKENGHKFFFNLSKKKRISSDDLLKKVALPEPTHIPLSTSQLQQIKDNIGFIHQWKFSLVMNEQCTKLKLTSVPGMFDRIATPNDFTQFLQAIETRSYDVSLVRPAFIKRTLASYACRYAIMFGDVLTEKNCKEVIQDLSNCDMSFICAHGRPSVVPLIDLASIETQVEQMNSITSNNDTNGTGYIPIRFRKGK